MKQLVYIVLLLLLCLTSTAVAFDPSDIQPNKSYLTTGMINLRDAPPKTIFYILGDKKGVVEKDDEVIVKEVKSVPTLLGEYYWFNVERTNPKTKTIDQGWIYGGEKGEKSLLMEKKQ